MKFENVEEGVTVAKQVDEVTGLSTLVVIDPKQIHRNKVPPPVVIEQVLDDKDVIYGDDINGNSKIQSLKFKVSGQSEIYQLPAGRARVLEIHYTANSLVAPEKVRFKYRLFGYDRDWCEAGNRRVAFYHNLRPGKYRFEVTATNPHGVTSRAPPVFEFSLAPHFWQTWPFYVFCATIAVGSIAALQAYRLKWQRRLLKLEEQRALANQRTRIARDLHDDLGTALTGLALELDVVGRQANGESSLAKRLGETARRTRDLAERMREVVWTVNPRCDTVSSLASFLEQQVSQFLRVDGLRVHLAFPEDIPALPLGAEGRHQLALSVREALTNVVRHSQATEVIVSLAIANQSLVVEVKDNGKGFESSGSNGQGLSNMRSRLEQVGGSFECVSSPGAGTRLIFRLPLTPTTGTKLPS